jgi:hypothetical protein
MPTVSQLFGLTPAETNAYYNTIAGEAFQGGRGGDIAGVAQNLIARRLAGNWGGTNMVSIAKSPSQYVANDPFTVEEISQRNIRRLSPEAFQRLVSIAEDPSRVGAAFKQSQGSQSFRGQELLKNRKPGDVRAGGDVMYEPEGNFFFNPLRQDLYEKGMQVLQGGSPFRAKTGQHNWGVDADVQIASAEAVGDSPNTTISPNSPGNIIVNNYIGDGTETKQKQQKSFVDSLIGSLLNQALNKRNSMDSILNEMAQQGSTSLNPLDFIA